MNKLKENIDSLINKYQIKNLENDTLQIIEQLEQLDNLGKIDSLDKLNEIYDFIDEINKSEIIDMNKIFKKEKEIIIFPDENSEKEDNECEEILNIYKNRSPFKPLKTPRKVSLIGKVLINDCVNNNNKESKK